MILTLAQRSTCVSLRWSQENFLGVARSINISPRWGEMRLIAFRFPVHCSRFPIRGMSAQRFNCPFMHSLRTHVAPVLLKFFLTKIRIGCSFFIL